MVCLSFYTETSFRLLPCLLFKIRKGASILGEFIPGAVRVPFSVFGYYLSEEIHCLSQRYERVGVGTHFYLQS